MKKILLLIVSIILIGFGIKSVFIDEFNRDGVYYKLSIEGKVPIRQRLNAFAIRIQNELDREEIVYDNLKINNNKFTFEFLDEDDALKVRKILNNYTSIFNVEKNEYVYHLSFKAKYLKQEESQLLEKTKKVLAKRLETMGLYKALFDVFRSEKTTIITRDDKFIEITIPKLCDKCPEGKVEQILASVGYFSLMPLNENDELMKDSIPIIDSSLLKKVSLVFKDDKSQLNIQVNEYGTKILADYTARNILKKMAILVDDKIYSMPRIVDGIWHGSFVVGLEELSKQEISNLAFIVDTGVLASPIQVEKKYSIVVK